MSNDPAVIMLIEDSADILKINRLAFEMAGYSVLTAMTLAKAESQLAKIAPDAMILDIMLPDGSGLDFCKSLREGSHRLCLEKSSLSGIPVLFLTCLDEEEQVIHGLDIGGDEYITKPYRVGELVSRVGALLRRIDKERKKASRPTALIKIGSLRIDTNAQRAYVDGEDILLKPREFALLLYLTKNTGQRYTAEQLYDEIWGLSPEGDIRTVQSHIYSLRKKLRVDEQNAFSLRTERRKYYVLDTEE